MKLKGKNILITGGNSGIGYGVARECVSNGANVIISGKNRQKLDDASKELGVTAIQCDVSRIANIETLMEKVKQSVGQLDGLVVNAGIAKASPLEMVTEEHFDEQTNVNYKGAFFTIQKSLPLLRDNASVVLTSSVVTRKGMAGLSVYSATKATERSLARTLSAELAHKGIRVNVVSPGPIETPIYSKMGLSDEQVKQFSESVLSIVPLKRFGKVEDVSPAFIYLLSSESSYITGSEIVVDGGMTEI